MDMMNVAHNTLSYIIDKFCSRDRGNSGFIPMILGDIQLPVYRVYELKLLAGINVRMDTLFWNHIGVIDGSCEAHMYGLISISTVLAGINWAFAAVSWASLCSV